MDPENQAFIKRIVEEIGGDDIVVMLGAADPEAEFLQAIAFATLALFFTQNRNQEGARIVLDDALVALGKYRPTFLGVRVDPIVAALSELRPLLAGLAAEDDCPLYPFAYPKFEFVQ